jgi:CTP:molybdopterin cytidylyltransferase MocA
MGQPKALVELAGQPLLRRALDVLRAGGCSPLVVVLGAGAEQAAELVPDDVSVVVADDWADGMGASLRAGLAALEQRDTPAALVHLVDLPGVGAEAISRLVGALDTGSGRDTLARAGYHGVPGHPVLLGRSHWDGVRAAAVGDAGARDYLAGHPALRLVECGDVADPRDVDTPEALRTQAGRAGTDTG